MHLSLSVALFFPDFIEHSATFSGPSFLQICWAQTEHFSSTKEHCGYSAARWGALIEVDRNNFNLIFTTVCFSPKLLGEKLKKSIKKNQEKPPRTAAIYLGFIRDTWKTHVCADSYFNMAYPSCKGVCTLLQPHYFSPLFGNCVGPTVDRINDGFWNDLSSPRCLILPVQKINK